jgi:inorganic pyrophosphatase
MRWWLLLATVALSCGYGTQAGHSVLEVLPASAVTQLQRSLEAAQGHAHHVWRDTPPTNANGTVNALIEIPQGERNKWEFDMRANVRAVDRVMPEDVGGYPVNYGFVPQTVAWDGDPFDALVLGPPLAGGKVVRGAIVGLMYMTDEKGPDSKVVLSIPGEDGRPVHSLSAGDQQRIGDYFKNYKRHEPGKFSKVPGWGTVQEGRWHVAITHEFFVSCRQPTGAECRP